MKYSKLQVYELLDRISSKIAKALIEASAFTKTDKFGTEFNYGKLYQWSNLGFLSNVLRNVNLDIHITQLASAAFDPSANAIILKGNENTPQESIESLIRHELEHIIQRFRSKGKAFKSTPHKSTTPTTDSRSVYFQLQHEIEARFAQAVQELNNTVGLSDRDLIIKVFDLFDKYQLTEIFKSKNRTKIKIGPNVVRLPLDNAHFKKLISKAIRLYRQ